jgi:hypothetical protein
MTTLVVGVHGNPAGGQIRGRNRKGPTVVIETVESNNYGVGIGAGQPGMQGKFLTVCHDKEVACGRKCGYLTIGYCHPVAASSQD